MLTSKQLFFKSLQSIPGGVNSPVRAFNGVGGTPLFIKRAKDAFIYDEEGHQYIDYVGSWGPMILGHAHPKILEAVKEQLENGLSYGAPTALEIELAEKIKTIMPNIEKIRMVNSGTEATMSAIRLARGFTQRDKIIKFSGCYHGHADSLLVQAGSGALTLGIPSSAGVPQSIVQHTLIAEFNSLETVQRYFERYPEEIAAIIVEPVAGNMNCVLPKPGFLEGLRNLCDAYNSVLIFDEVMTGFRVARGGAQEKYNIKPDLTTLGKIIGGGLPVGAFGGRQEIMDHIAPLGPVYQAGTLSGNPIAMAAGLAGLNLISESNFHAQLAKMTDTFIVGLKNIADAAHIPLVTNHVTGMFGFFFTDLEKVETFADVKMSNVPRFKRFFHEMLKSGVYFAPSAFEAGFISSAHTSEVIDQTLSRIAKVFETSGLR